MNRLALILALLLSAPSAFADPHQDCLTVNTNSPPVLQRLCADIARGAQPSSRAINYLHEKTR